MITKFNLIGLSRPKSATITIIGDVTETTYQTSVDVSDEVFEQMWWYCKNHWRDKKTALVEHDGYTKTGAPIRPVMKSLQEQ